MTTDRARSAPGTDDFVTYDELDGPDLNAELWSPAGLPLPTGGVHNPTDPAADVAVADGEARVTIPRFSLSHDTFQPADSAKYLVFSTGEFELPPDRPATFIPERARLGFGIWTMLPIRHGRSRSLAGQGMRARRVRFRTRGVDAGAD